MYIGSKVIVKTEKFLDFVTLNLELIPIRKELDNLVRIFLFRLVRKTCQLPYAIIILMIENDK